MYVQYVRAGRRNSTSRMQQMSMLLVSSTLMYLMVKQNNKDFYLYVSIPREYATANTYSVLSCWNKSRFWHFAWISNAIKFQYFLFQRSLLRITHLHAHTYICINLFKRRKYLPNYFAFRIIVQSFIFTISSTVER